MLIAKDTLFNYLHTEKYFSFTTCPYLNLRKKYMYKETHINMPITVFQNFRNIFGKSACFTGLILSEVRATSRMFHDHLESLL